MSDMAPARLWDIIEDLRSRKDTPLIHCIMNYVAAPDCANMILAAGAKPVMADCPDETDEVSSKAAALVLNMGTFSPQRGEAMLNAGKAANAQGIPVILDPVGLSASALRREWFMRLTKEISISAVKCNIHEAAQIVGEEAADNTEPRLVKAAAEKLGCTVLLTGYDDYIAEGGRVWRICNGTTLLAKVTGTGCMTGALAGAFTAASGSAAEGCAAAVALMDICGELAAESTQGLGSFRVKLFDLITDLTRGEFLGRLNISEC